MRRGDVVEAMLPLKPEKPGSYAYEIRVADPAADASAKSQPFVIAVRQEGRSVLLLSNTLGFEGKFLRRALTTDRNVRLDSFARWQDGRWASIDGGKDTLDLSAAGLSSRSAIVLADVSPDALDPAQWQAIADFAGKGGGLVVLGGPNLLGSPQAAACLGRVLPVPTPAPHRDGRFGVKLTDAGLRHPVFGPLFESVRNFPALAGRESRHRRGRQRAGADGNHRRWPGAPVGGGETTGLGTRRRGAERHALALARRLAGVERPALRLRHVLGADARLARARSGGPAKPRPHRD